MIVFAVSLVAAWTLGGLVLRLGGALAFWAGLLGLLAGAGADGALVALLGAVAWVLGHLHHAFRRGDVRRTVARLILARLEGLISRRD